MDRPFFIGNRKRIYEKMKPHSLLVLFSGEEVRTMKTIHSSRNAILYI